MAEDLIRYDLLAQAALRGVVRTVLADVAENGLPGEHHFKITFATHAPGVRLSDRMLTQYPQVMTIILQHQFWDLAVNDEAFEVGLSFGGVAERLTVPFDAIIAFFDPSVQFGFQFQPAEGVATAEPPTATQAAGPEASAESHPTGTLPPPAAGAADDGTGPTGGGEVVRLDRFRKK